MDEQIKKDLDYINELYDKAKTLEERLELKDQYMQIMKKIQSVEDVEVTSAEDCESCGS